MTSTREHGGVSTATDHYRVLQVTRDAEPEVIERAYRALSRKYHPDVATGDAVSANHRMAEVNEAFRVLRDPSLRRAYDATLGPEGIHGWDLFWERGLVGLFLDRFGR